MNMTPLRCHDHTLSFILNIIWLYGPEIRPRVQFIAVFLDIIIAAIVEVLDSSLRYYFLQQM